MLVRVLLFGRLSDLAPAKLDLLEVPDDATAGSVIDSLLREFPVLGDALKSVALAVNLAYVRKDHRLKPGDEVALIPPVSGG